MTTKTGRFGVRAAARRSPAATAKPDPVSATDLVATITRTLRSWRDPARAEGVQRYFKHTVVALGIDTPTLRAYVNEQVARVRPLWTVKPALACCAGLLAQPEMELRGAGLLLLAGFQRHLTAEFVPTAESWLRNRLDNWALVDSFCSLVLSPLLNRDPNLESALRRWSKADSLWVRRAALVTLVPGARRGQRLGLAYDLATEHLADPEDLMHKATGWLLREAGKTDPARLRQFLLSHGPSIPRTTLRYAIERFSVTERAKLLRVTRGP